MLSPSAVHVVPMLLSSNGKLHAYGFLTEVHVSPLPCTPSNGDSVTMLETRHPWWGLQLCHGWRHGDDELDSVQH